MRGRIMKMFDKYTGAILVLILLLASVFTACAPAAPAAGSLKDIVSAPLSITILHVGDTHSYVMAHDVMLNINGRDTLVSLGGWGLMASAIEDIRAKEKNVMLLHAGDVTEGTIWMPKFEGMADFAAMNSLNFDAVTLGNHEFAHGNQLASIMVDTLKFPVLAANLDLSQEPALNGRVKPYTIVEYEGQKIGIIGLITPDTTTTASPGKNIKFLPPEDIARKYVSELNGMSINKIIVLSHLGYEPDVKLAKSVPGIDIIVGGHSHTLMGGPEFTQIGLKPEMPYPTELVGPTGDIVLIVHAWEYNQMLGQIKLSFDDHGRIRSYSGQPFIFASNSFKVHDNGWSHLCSCQAQFGEIMAAIANNPGIKIYWSSTAMDNVLQPYVQQIGTDLNTVVGIADEDLIRGPDVGPGPVVADAFLWSARKVDPNVQLAVYDSYQVDADIFEGLILANDINMVLDLRYNLATVTLKGSLLKMMMEMGLDSHIKVQMPPPCFEIAGFKMTIDMTRKSGDRITDIQVATPDGGYVPMNMDAEYTMVTTDFLIEKGIAPLVNKVSWMGPLTDSVKAAALGFLKYRPLGIHDVDAMTDYVRIQKNIKNPTTIRTTLIQPPVK
jgi:5'-nucleotidase / UDP-sugar diphosphatase